MNGEHYVWHRRPAADGSSALAAADDGFAGHTPARRGHLRRAAVVQRVLGPRQLHLAARRDARDGSLRGSPRHPDLVRAVPGPRSRLPLLRTAAEHRQAGQHRLPHDGRHAALGHRAARLRALHGRPLASSPSCIRTCRPASKARSQNFTDASGYLVHADNETWMDARREPDKVVVFAAQHASQRHPGAVVRAAAGRRRSSRGRWRRSKQRPRAGQQRPIGCAAISQRDFVDPATGRIADHLDARDVPNFAGATQRAVRAVSCWSSRPLPHVQRARPGRRWCIRGVWRRSTRPIRAFIRTTVAPESLSQGCGLP